MAKRFVIVLILFCIIAFSYVFSLEEVIYTGTITNIQKQVYDGDTINNVLMKVADKETKDGEVWPGVVVKKGEVYVSFDLRINGIDTPEKRPRKAGRTGVSLKNEKFAASRSRQAVIDLLNVSNGHIRLKHPKTGKYAGRMLANAYILDERDELISIADYLIERGLALPYDGGTKTKVNWDILNQGYMLPIDKIAIPPEQ